MKNNVTASITGALVILAALALPVSADRLAYEGFEYTQANGTSIVGLNGGTGWTEAYPSTDGTLSLQDGLSFTGFAPTPGKSIQRPGNGTMSNNGRNWAASITTGTYYYSFLMKPTATASNVGRGTFGILQGSGSNQNGFGIRFDFTGTAGPTATLTFNANTPAQAPGTNVTFASGWGQTYLVIGRLTVDTAANTTNAIWVYQNGQTIPSVLPSPMSSTTGGTGTVIPAMYGRSFGDSAITFFDEVRVGNTFEEVLPPPNLVLSPTSGAEGQQLTFTWTNIPASATAIKLDPGDIDLLPDTTAGAGTKSLFAPADNTTYTLTYTVGGIDSTLTQNFTVIPPSFTLSPLTGYPGDTLTLNWQVPIGSTDVTLTPDVGTPVVLTGTSPTTGAGTTTLPAPSVTTVYSLSYTYNSNTVTLPTTQTFTPNASFLSVTPEVAVATRPLTISWRILPEWNDNALPEDNVVRLQSSPTGDFVSNLLDNVVVTTNTNGTTGAGSYNLLPATLGLFQYRLVYKIGGVETVLAATITQVQPLILTNLTASGLNNVNNPPVVNTALMNNGVPAYIDRTHEWSAVPSILQGAQFVKLAQADKASPAFQVSFTAAQTGTFFLLLDNRVGDNAGGTNPTAGTDSPPLLPNSANSMAWVLNSGFVDSGLDIGLDEKEVGEQIPGINASYSVYFRQVSQGETFTFYEQNDTSTGGPGFRNMYGIAAVSPQIVPIAFVAVPPVITNGVNTSSLQWTVTPGSTVSIDPPVGTLVTDPVTGVGSISINPTATTAYTLTYDPPGTATPAVNLGPVTVTVNYFTATPSTINEGENITFDWQVPVGATAVTISNGVGDVTGDTINGVGTKTITPTVSGSYTLTYIASGATTPTTVATRSVTVIPSASFVNWIAGDFGGNTVPLGQRGPNDDPDNDGIDNLVEYAVLGGDPTRSTGSPAVITGTLVTFNKNPDAAGISYALEKSSTLAGDWVSAAATTNNVNVITYTLAPPNPDKEFVRLKVTQN